MYEHNIGYYHRHETFIRGSTETRYHACTNEAWIARYEGLPYIGQDADQSTDNKNRPSAEDVRRRHNQEVCITEGDGRNAKKHVDFWDRLVEFVLEDDRERSYTEWCHDGDKSEDKLVGNHDRLPCPAPILWIPIIRNSKNIVLDMRCTYQGVIKIRCGLRDENHFIFVGSLATARVPEHDFRAGNDFVLVRGRHGWSIRL